MIRSLSILSAAALLAVGAQAQCLTPATGASVQPGFVKWNSTAGYTSTFVVQDEGLTNPPIALTAFPNFPMAGAIGNLDRMWVNSNGEVYLTDSTLGLTQPANGILYGATDLAEMRGAAAGASARVVALGGDNSASAVAGAVWDIAVDQSVPGEVRITWTDMARLGSTATDRFSFDCTLFASGAVRYTYSASVPAAARFVGISIGNNVGSTSSPSRDLTNLADSGAEGLLYESFTAASWDLAGRQIMLIPNGLGGYFSTITCTPAFHQAYGTGCYAYSAATESFYQEWANTAAASATLNGNAMQLIPNGNGYIAAWLPGAAATMYVAPTGSATLLPTTDDGNQAITPSVPMPSPFGAAAQLNVMHNGVVTLSATANNAGDYTPSPADLAASTGTGFYTWFDFNDAEAGSGRIKTEEVGGVLYITWDGVEGYDSPAVVNPHTFQFQLDLNTGIVTYVWTSINTNSFAGRMMAVAYSDAGTSIAPTSIDLPTALPLITFPDVTLQPLALSASPAPTYTIGNPSVPITYTASNMIDLVPPLGIGLGILLFSVAPFPGGLDMGFLDMPGCNLNILSLDVTIPLPGTAPTASAVLSIPQPLSPGLSFYSQVLCLFTPNSLPNGQNAFGGILSNGLQSYFNTL
ncbi:MAG: hypothetical protein JNK78_03770 [Planctomycetes bacterium]|nr:hypothetical protein [Planctomycetota bacterium]